MFYVKSFHKEKKVNCALQKKQIFDIENWSMCSNIRTIVNSLPFLPLPFPAI